jgi:hypothetical protein
MASAGTAGEAARWTSLAWLCIEGRVAVVAGFIAGSIAERDQPAQGRRGNESPEALHRQACAPLSGQLFGSFGALTLTESHALQSVSSRLAE